jgi:hypothetical protein
MSRYAIVKNGVVENVVVWDGGAGWSPPKDRVAERVGDDVGPGYRWDGEAWVAPAPPAPPVVDAGLDAKLTALEARIAALESAGEVKP